MGRSKTLSPFFFNFSFFCSSSSSSLHDKYIFIQALDDSCYSDAELLSKKLNLPLINKNHDFSKYTVDSYNILQLSKEKLKLCYFMKGKNKFGFSVFFPVTSYYTDFDLYNKNSLTNKNPLIRSMISDYKLNNNNNNIDDLILLLKQKTIVDGTAGLGVDSFLLAKFGCKVLLIEKNPIVYALLEDGFNRINKTDNNEMKEIINNMKLLENMDCCDYFNNINHTQQDKPDIIYLDPLIHTKNKRQLLTQGKKYKHLPRVITGSPNKHDQKILIDLARQTVNDKVIVKKPYFAELDTDISIQPIKSRHWRCDIYLPKK